MACPQRLATDQPAMATAISTIRHLECVLDVECIIPPTPFISGANRPRARTFATMETVYPLQQNSLRAAENFLSRLSRRSFHNDLRRDYKPRPFKTKARGLSQLHE